MRLPTRAFGLWSLAWVSGFLGGGFWRTEKIAKRCNASCQEASSGRFQKELSQDHELYHWNLPSFLAEFLELVSWTLSPQFGLTLQAWVGEIIVSSRTFPFVSEAIDANNSGAVSTCPACVGVCVCMCVCVLFEGVFLLLHKGSQEEEQVWGPPMLTRVHMRFRTWGARCPNQIPGDEPQLSHVQQVILTLVFKMAPRKTMVNPATNDNRTR